MSEKLIKSKQRVKDFAEVFTPKHIVKDMCDLVPEEMWVSVDTTFLEPACGTGNFLVEILERKFKLCQSWEDGLRALKSIYGMDIQADNVEEAKGRLFDMYIKQYLDMDTGITKLLQIAKSRNIDLAYIAGIRIMEV